MLEDYKRFIQGDTAILPESISEIEDDAFAFCTSLKSIIIPDSVTEIGIDAFRDCNSLEEVKIPNSVKEIEESAFSNCTSLKSIRLPKSLENIWYEAFKGCVSLAEVTFSDSGSIQIHDDAFDGCKALRCLSIPESAYINPGVFRGCVSLAFVRIPSSVEFVDLDYSNHPPFEGCSELEAVEIVCPWTREWIDLLGFERNNHLRLFPDVIDVGVGIAKSILGTDVRNLGLLNLKRIRVRFSTIADHAFDGCVSLETVEIPSFITKIGASAFSGCSSLRSIVIPNSVTEIGCEAFSGCVSLVAVKVPSSVREIGDQAFAGCTSLRSIEIPDSVTDVGKYLWDYNCEELEELIIHIKDASRASQMFLHSLMEEYVSEIDPKGKQRKQPEFNHRYLKWVQAELSVDSLTLCVPEESMDGYKAEEFFQGFSEIIPIKH